LAGFNKMNFHAWTGKSYQTMNLYCFVILNFFCGRFVYITSSPSNKNFFFFVTYELRTIVFNTLCIMSETEMMWKILSLMFTTQD